MRNWSRKKVAVVSHLLISGLLVLVTGSWLIPLLFFSQVSRSLVIATCVLIIAAGVHLVYFCREVAQFYEELYLSPRASMIPKSPWHRINYQSWFYALTGIFCIVMGFYMLIRFSRR